MFYVLTNADGTVKRYPYTLTDLINDNRSVSFGIPIDAETLKAFGVYPVQPSEQPAYDYKINTDRIAVKQGDQWIEQWISSPATAEEAADRLDSKSSEVRYVRNQKLMESDWTQLSDAPVNSAEWATYRQALRDITSQVGFPWEITWPEEPA